MLLPQTLRERDGDVTALRRRYVLPAVPCALAAVLLAARPSAPPAARPSEAARIVSRQLPQMHLSHRPFDDALATNALNVFLSSLDFDHSYFLAGDVAAFSAAATNLDDQLRAGDVSFAYRVYDVFRERVSNRVAYVDLLLTNGFDFSEQESYRWKRKDATWPADEAAWDELWRKKIKNQYLAQLVARRIADENATNDTAAADAKTNSTDRASDVANAKLSPEDFVRKSYRQHLTILNDNDADWVLERYLTSFAAAYDPHTDYLSASNTEDFDIGMKLSLFGIGALLSSEDGAAKVERLIPGGPAEKDGRLKPGDKIVGVAQGGEEPVDILHWPLSKAVRLIRGKKGSKVVLTVIPASDATASTTVQIDLVRDEVKLEEQAAKGDVREVVGPDGAKRRLGVITLPEFYADISARRGGASERRSSSHDVAVVLSSLRTQHVDGIVLDLRNNGGGLLAEAVEMTGLFIDSGPVVQVSDGRHMQVLSDTDPDTAYKGPLVVLVNRQTASASEILAGALQDYGRAVIVGDSKTHGKGTVQTLANVKTGNPALGTMKVTTASFYRIAGGSTQLRGIEPDIVAPSLLDSMEVGEEHLPNALPWSAVDPARVRPKSEVAGYLPELRSSSEKRQATDQRLGAYRRLLDRLGERQKDREISLNLEERLALARGEKELQKLIENADAKTDGEEAVGQDLVLTEALNILSDLVVLEERADSLAASTAPARAAETGN